MQAIWLSFFCVIRRTNWQKGALKLTKRLLITYLIGFFAFSSVIGLFLFNPFGTKETQAAWFNDNWGYRKRIDLTITSSASDISNLDTLLTIDTTGITANLQTNCEDLRFTDIKGTILPHFIDTCNDNNATNYVWVRTNLVPKNTTTYTLYMYYGNSAAISTSDSVTFNLYNGLDGYWTTNESSWLSCVGEVKNSAAGGLDATCAGGANTTTGKFGNAGTFAGDDDVVNLGTLSYTASASSLTWAFWIKPTSLATSKCILCKGNRLAGTNQGWDIATDATNSQKLVVEIPTTTTDTTTNGITTNTVLSNSTWAHVVVVFNGAGSANADKLKVYVDGNEVAMTFSGSIPSSTQAPAANTRMAGASDAAAFLNGVIDDTRIYSRVFSPSDVTQLYNGGNQISAIQSAATATSKPSTAFASEEKGPTATLYWKFDDGQGSTTQDSTINNLDGTLETVGSSGSSSGPTKIDDASNFGTIAAHRRKTVRTSTGTLYTAIADTSNCEIWKSSDGSSWTQVDAGTTLSCTSHSSVSLAVDSNDTLHIVYRLLGAFKYRTMTADTFSGEESIYSYGNYGVYQDLVLDSNNIPHVVIQGGDNVSDVVGLYTNRIGGTWKSPVTVESFIGNNQGIVWSMSLALNEDNVVEVCYLNGIDSDLTAAVADQNNATSFTLQDVDTSTNNTGGQRGASMAIDSAGNTWIGYVDFTSNQITLVKHNDADSWSTWQTPVTNSNAGYEPTIAINGTDIYVFYEDASTDLNDIKYDRYNGSSWLGETLLHAGTSNTDAVVSWNFLNNNSPAQLDYLYSDGTDVYWATLGISVADTTPDWKSDDLCISGKCLFFDGSSTSRVKINDTSNLDFAAANSFSVGAWAKRNGTVSSNSYIIAKADTTNGGYKVYMDDSGDLCFGIDDDSTWGPDVASCTSGVDFDDDKWHYVVGVRDVNADKTYLYIDGAERDSDTDPTSATLANANQFLVGSDRDGISGKWKGFIDEVKVYNFALSASQVKSNFDARGNSEGVAGVLGANSQNLTGALSNGLVRYYKMDEGTANQCSGGTNDYCDSSGSAVDGTQFGSATWASGKFGTAASFDGTDDAASFSTTDPLGTTSAATFSAWVYLANTTGTKEVFNKDDASSNQGWSFYVTGSDVGFYVDPTNSSAVTASLAATTWTHLTWVYDRGTVTVYKDGAQIGSQGGFATSLVATNGTFDIGLKHLDSSGDFNGRIDDARVYNRALSGAEVAQLYNWAPGPVGQWEFEEGSGTSVKDSSINTNTGTFAGSGTTRWKAGKYGSAGNFNGSDDRVSLASTTGFSTGSGAAWTIEAWIKLNSTSGTQIFAGYGDGSTNGNSPHIAMDSGSWRTSTWGAANDLNGSSATANVWTHVVGVGSGTTLTLFINGAQSATKTITNTPVTGGGRIGSAPNAIDSNANGLIDSVRIYNYARTQAQIVEDMNAGHPAPGSPVGSAVGYWKFDEGFGTTANDSNSSTGGAENLTLSTASWTTAGKFGKAFDGADNKRLSISNNSNLDFSDTDDFSVSLWFKSDSAGAPANRQYLLASGPDNSLAGYALYANTSGNICFGIDDDTTSEPPEISSCNSANMYDTNWHYVMGVRDHNVSDKVYIYIDGLLIGSGTSDTTTATLDGNSAFYISDGNATDGTDEFLGNIDEVKVFRSLVSADQVKLDMNRGAAEVSGSLSSTQSLPNSADAEYCVPGSSDTCTAPVGRWDFEEGSGSTANDSSGNNLGGTISNGTYTFGKQGKALLFNNSNTMVSVTNSNPIDFDTTLATGNTFSAWIYPKSQGESPTSGGYIFSKGSSYLRVDTLTGNSVDVEGNLDLTGTDANVNITTPINVNTWNYISMVYADDADDEIDIYINGVLRGTSTGGSGSPAITDTADLTIGNVPVASGTFDGMIDSFRIYSYARTPAQVAWDYNKGAPVAWWKMDECQGTTINDSSGNGLSGTWSTGGSGILTAGTCGGSAGTAWADGAIGKRNYSMAFDGIDDKVDFGAPAALKLTDQIGISMWVKPDSNALTSGEHAMIHNYDGGGTTAQYELAFMSGGLEFNYGSSSSYVTYVPSPTVSFTAGTWYHIVFTDSGSNGTGTFYINGVRYSGSKTGSVAKPNSGNGNTVIGSNTFSGLLDDIRIFGFTLTDAQAKTIYNDGATRYGPTTGAP